MTYTTPGQYSVTCHTVIDTLSFNYLNNVTVLGTSCTDFLGTPDLYVVVKNQTGTSIYQAPVVLDTDPPVSFTLPGIQLYHNQNYSIEVWDEDGGLAGADDQCNTFQVSGTSTSNSMWSGSDGISFVTDRPFLSFTDTATVHVYPQPLQPVITANPSNGVCVNDSILLISTNASNYQWHNDTSLLLGATQQNMYVYNAGKYFVIITDTNGCQAQSDTSIISFYSNPPKPTFWRIDDTLRTNLTGYTLQWNWNGNPISGATGQLCHIEFAGTYSLLATSVQGCTKLSDVIYYSPFNTGIDDSDALVSDFVLYPNPNDGNFKVRFNTFTVNDFSLLIYDMLGKQVYNEELKSFSGTYDKEPDIKLNPSVYFLELRTADKKVLKREKIVVQ